jgi:hypothetical protein
MRRDRTAERGSEQTEGGTAVAPARSSRARDHVGVLSGMVLGLAALTLLLVLAIDGVEAARTLLIVPAVGVGLIAIGSWMRRP